MVSRPYRSLEVTVSFPSSKFQSDGLQGSTLPAVLRWAPWALLLVACAGPTAEAAPSQARAALVRGGAGREGKPNLSQSQRAFAEKLTSIWENDTPELQYGYAENIGDGRGITSGRAGFCTGTGDALRVVACLDGKTAEKNPLHRYRARLEQITQAFETSGTNQSTTAGLDGYGEAWKATDAQPQFRKAFRACQDQVVEELYFRPALQLAERVGLRSALSMAALYDACIQHGTEGTQSMTQQVSQEGLVTVRSPADEERWLRAFLRVRRRTLLADRTWAESVGRVDNYEALVDENNWSLDRPFVTRTTSSGYTVYTLRP